MLPTRERCGKDTDSLPSCGASHRHRAAKQSYSRSYLPVVPCAHNSQCPHNSQLLAELTTHVVAVVTRAHNNRSASLAAVPCTNTTNHPTTTQGQMPCTWTLQPQGGKREKAKSEHLADPNPNPMLDFSPQETREGAP